MSADDETPDPGTPFEIGLVMTGAISAGAYTAGVIDFLLQALDEWQRAKDAGHPDCPPHRVRLKVMAGASAGGMTAALSVGMLGETFEYATSYPAGAPLNNKLFDCWVNKSDIAALLGTDDLTDLGRPIRSILDSTAPAEIAASAFKFVATRTSPSRPYLSDPLHVLVTVTNLRGVPFQVNFDNPAPGGYRMMLHGDYVHFTYGTAASPQNGGIPLPPRKYDAPAWQTLQLAALATGAFPVALAPRELSFPASSYGDRRWLNFPPAVASARPDWPPIDDAVKADPGYPFAFACIDGGVINNDPLDLARAILFDGAGEARQGPGATRAVIMIDPFPNANPYPTEYTPPASLPAIVAGMFVGLLDQARFQPSELAQADDPDVYSRFLIVPERRDEHDREQRYAIASGSLKGFGGFLARDFREHDFFLGRRNCQRFLRKHFALPYPGPSEPSRNRLFDGWTEAARRRHRIVRSKGGEVRSGTETEADDDEVLLPIIPLLGTADHEVMPAPWPKFTADDCAALRPRIEGRVHALGQFAIKRHLTGVWEFLPRENLLLLWDLIQGHITDYFMTTIEDDLRLRGLM
jgi:hypothetical protein